MSTINISKISLRIIYILRVSYFTLFMSNVFRIDNIV